MEAFRRPIDDLGRPIHPREFIDDAGHCGLMAAHVQLMLEPCFKAARLLRLQGRGLPLVVNLRTHALARVGLAEAIITLAVGRGIAPAGLTLEVRETALNETRQRSLSELSRLRDAGFQILLDDFGIGYSSIDCLADWSIDGLKIDQSLRGSILADPRRRVLVAAIVGFARELDLVVVAEGVENAEQGQALLAMGCALVQGFLFGRPATLDRAQFRPDQLQPLPG